jgi:single-strand DNA-binding protein
MNLNKVALAGRLVREPEVKFTTKGTAIAEIDLAVTRFFKTDDGQTKEETDFISVTAFGRTAEVLQKHAPKGRCIYLEGRLKLEQWDDKQTGAKRSKLKVIAEAMQFVGPKSESPKTEAARSQAPAARPAPPDLHREPEDIPF